VDHPVRTAARPGESCFLQLRVAHGAAGDLGVVDRAVGDLVGSHRAVLDLHFRDGIRCQLGIGDVGVQDLDGRDGIGGKLGRGDVPIQDLRGRHGIRRKLGRRHGSVLDLGRLDRIACDVLRRHRAVWQHVERAAGDTEVADHDVVGPDGRSWPRELELVAGADQGDAVVGRRPLEYAVDFDQEHRGVRAGRRWR